MPEQIGPDPLAPTTGEPDHPLARRTVLTGALAAGAVLASAPSALAAPGRRPADDGRVGVSGSSIAVSPGRL
ncbi:hypothetical protein AB0G02_39770, partial [Actinosynnema sp. NPDC023658]|uniref:hypothetical protein n=1 Tax=Actinosynnema sp. NPDC023658 TaxID=3155465 RepID=UPI0033FA92BF